MTPEDANTVALNYALGYIAGLGASENECVRDSANSATEVIDAYLRAAVAPANKTREREARANKGVRGHLEDLVYEAMPRYGDRVRELDERGRQRFFERVAMALASDVAVAISHEERLASEQASEQALADRILDAISNGREQDERVDERDA